MVRAPGRAQAESPGPTHPPRRRRCEKGIGRTHAKWSPVATAAYRLLPEVTLRKRVTGAEADALVARCPMSVFDIEDAGGERAARVSRPRNCSMCRECVRQPEWAELVKLNRVRDHFIFTVESSGSMPAEAIFREAVKVLMAKVRLPRRRPVA